MKAFVNSSIFNKVLSIFVKSCHHSTSSTFHTFFTNLVVLLPGGFVRSSPPRNKNCAHPRCPASCPRGPAVRSYLRVFNGAINTENPWILGNWILDFRSSTLNIHKLFAITKGLMNSTIPYHIISSAYPVYSMNLWGRKSTSVINSESSCPKHLSSTLIFAPINRHIHSTNSCGVVPVVIHLGHNSFINTSVHTIRMMVMVGWSSSVYEIVINLDHLTGVCNDKPVMLLWPV